MPAKQKTASEDCALGPASVNRSRNVMRVISKPPISHPSPQISTRRPMTEVIRCKRNAATFTQDTKSRLNPEYVRLGLHSAMKFRTIIAVDCLTLRVEGTRLLLRPGVARRSRMTLMSISEFPVLVAIDKLSQKSLLEPRFNNRPWIKTFVTFDACLLLVLLWRLASSLINCIKPSRLMR